MGSKKVSSLIPRLHTGTVFGRVYGLLNRVSELACFGAAPAPSIFFPEPALAPAPAPEDIAFWHIF